LEEPHLKLALAHKEPKPSVFSDNAVNGPHSRNVINPACGAARDRDYTKSCGLELGQGRKGFRNQSTLPAKGVVDIAKHTLESLGSGSGEFGNGPWCGHVYFLFLLNNPGLT
jgi:hypothetical protein